MDMDTPNLPKPPELETEPAGEANTTVSSTLPINDAVEPLQTEVPQPPTEPIPTQETAQTEPLSEPIPKTPTPQLPVDEALTESEPAQETSHAEAPTNTPESGNLDSGSPPRVLPFSTTENRGENLVAGTGMTMPAPQTQQGTVQPEPQPTPASPPESLPAQAPIIAIPQPQNIVGLILTKARLMI